MTIELKKAVTKKVQKNRSELKDESNRSTKHEINIKTKKNENGESKLSDLYDNLPDPKNSASLDEEESEDSSPKTKRRKKKDKKKKRKKEKERDRSDKNDLNKKKRELESQIHLAKKIAEKEKHEKRSSSQSSGHNHDGEKSRDRKHARREHRSTESPELKEKAAYPDYREKMLAKRREDARQAAREKKAALFLQQKKLEQAKDEVYDQLVKGGGKTFAPSDRMRKLKKGEHYEDAQREFLENEIRIRDRREQYSSTANASNRRVDFSNRGDAADFVDSRYHFTGRERSRSRYNYQQEEYSNDRRPPRYHYEKR